uniref:NR LBD domain-containing protein n=1 Tax=Caenorhabditis tropicalis TaxID=1561998 RepID=A0A1I7UQW0_9PELO
MTHEVFTNGPDVSKPPPKFSQSKFALSIIVQNMIWFISESNNPESTHSSAKAMIEHVNLILKDTVYLECEEKFIELEEKGMDLMEMKRYYKASINDSEKALVLTVWIAALVILVPYKKYVNYVKPLEIDCALKQFSLMYLFMMFYMIEMTPLFRFNLIHDDPPKKQNNTMGYMDDNGMNETALPDKMMNIQNNLIDFYLKEVIPLKQKSIKLKNYSILHG